jgi:hypothetical protein
VTPNPAPGRFDVAFATAAGEPWQLEVLDLSGRRVAELGRGIGSGAAITRRWDSHGTQVRAGVYWVRLARGAETLVRRVAILGER